MTFGLAATKAFEMMGLIELLLAEMMSASPELLMVWGAHEMPRARARKFLTVRRGRQSAIVEL